MNSFDGSPVPSADPDGSPGATSTESNESVAPAWPAPPVRARRASRPARTALLAGFVGALVGGAVAGGIVAAVGTGGTKTVVQTDAAASARPSTVVAPNDVRSILAKVQPAVVRIDATLSDGVGGTTRGTGTGFIVDASGVVVTNNHVVENASSLTVTLDDGDQVSGRVIGTAPAFDLAVVKVDHGALPAVALGDSDQLQVGDAVVAIGNALALEGGSGPTVTTGIVSALGRDVQINDTENLHDMVQTDAAINPGNSGGPLVDARGAVIGINTAIANPQDSNNVGFAIPISGALPIIDDLRAGKPPQAAFLGVKTVPFTPSIASAKHIEAESGALVVSVTPGSPAARASLHTDDVIVAVGGKSVHSPTDVFSAVRRHRPGDTVDVVVVRGSQRLTSKVTLSATGS